MKKKITVYRLFIASIIVLGTAFWLVQLNNASFNRISHECIKNVVPDILYSLEDLGYISEDEVTQDQGYCDPGSHPEIKDQWQTVNSYIAFISFFFFLPLALCTGAILAFREIRKTLH